MTTAADSEADKMTPSARPRRVAKRRPQWFVWIRVRPSAEEVAFEDELFAELEERIAHPTRDEHGRRFIPHAEVMADFERKLRVEVGATRRELRTWRRRVSRARSTENIARTVARGSFDVPRIDVVPADVNADPRMIQPPWHRRAGLTARLEDRPFIVIGHHDDAPEVDADALYGEIQQALEDAWDARLPWEQVEPRLREKYAHVWLGSHEGCSPPAYEDVYAAFEASRQTRSS